MKRFLMITMALVLALTAYAQPRGRGHDNRHRPQVPAVEIQDPETTAYNQTVRLDGLVRLTPQQFNRIYRFHKRQLRNLQNRTHRNPAQMREDLMRLENRTERKYRNVLTQAQYERWASFDAHRRYRRVY